MVVHALRYDDFSAISCTPLESLLIDMFMRKRVACTFAVVPFSCEPESLLRGSVVVTKALPRSKAKILAALLRAGLAEVALHGYSHLTLAPLRGYQEFSQRMPVEVQRQLIRRGREHLEDLFGTRIHLYVPPFNRLAASTATVLNEEGFFLSAGAPDGLASEALELKQLPCTNGIVEASRALATAQLFGRGNEWVGTIFHDYDFSESHLGAGELSLSQFETLLDQWTSARNVRHQLISDTIATGDTSDNVRARANWDLNRTISRGKIRRRLGASVRQVHWAATTARRFDRILKWLP